MPASRLCIRDDISKPNSVRRDVGIGSPRFFRVNPRSEYVTLQMAQSNRQTSLDISICPAVHSLMGS